MNYNFMILYNFSIYHMHPSANGSGVGFLKTCYLKKNSIGALIL